MKSSSAISERISNKSSGHNMIWALKKFLKEKEKVLSGADPVSKVEGSGKLLFESISNGEYTMQFKQAFLWADIK